MQGARRRSACDTSDGLRRGARQFVEPGRRPFPPLCKGRPGGVDLTGISLPLAPPYITGVGEVRSEGAFEAMTVPISAPGCRAKVAL